jgi:MFS family permease
MQQRSQIPRLLTRDIRPRTYAQLLLWIGMALQIPGTLTTGHDGSRSTTSQSRPSWASYRKSILSSVFLTHTDVANSSYGTSSYSPGIEGVAREFHVSREVAVLPLSLYVLGLAVGPLVAGGISETFGRRVVYLTCMPLCLLFTLGAGFSQSIGSLLVCRTLAATAGAAPLAIGAGTIADMFVPHRRAFGIGIWVLAPFLGPALGMLQSFKATYTF